MSLVDFLKGTRPDHQGRYLRDIWDFDDKAIEQTHDFIQWLFPLTEKSMSVLGAPTLSADDIARVRKCDIARANLQTSAQWYLEFLARNDHWIRSYDHNHLRITRAIKSLGLLVSQSTAEGFLNSVFQITGERLDVIRQDAVSFWKVGLSEAHMNG